MDGGFHTVFDLLQAGYRGAYWALICGALLGAGIAYLLWFKPAGAGERLYRNVLAGVIGIATVVFVAYQIRTYGAYLELSGALERGGAERTVGHITALFPQDYFLVFDVGGKRFRSSRYEWPYRLGFRPGDFPLKTTFLVRVDTVGGVIVRLAVHRVHLDVKQAGVQP